MRETFQDKIANAKNLKDVLLVLKESILRDICVSSLAYFDSVIEKYNGTYGIASVRPFPLEIGQDSYRIQVYYFSESGDEIKENTIVHILFADKNFIGNLQGVDTVSKATTDQTLHTQKFGIIVQNFGGEIKTIEKEIEKIDIDISSLENRVSEISQELTKKANKINVHVLTKFNSFAELDTNIFQTKTVYLDPSKVYHIALGTSSGYYFYRGNGQGVKAAENDYLHQRKKYTSFRIKVTEDKYVVTLRDILNFFFGSEQVTEWEFIKNVNPLWMEDTYYAYSDKGQNYILLTTKPADWEINYEEYFVKNSEFVPERINKFPGAKHDPSPTIRIKVPIKITNLISDSYLTQIFKRSCGQGYRGRLYIVVNKFARPGPSSGIFCESVYGYLHLMFSLEEIDSGNSYIYISALRH